MQLIGQIWYVVEEVKEGERSTLPSNIGMLFFFGSSSSSRSSVKLLLRVTILHYPMEITWSETLYKDTNSPHLLRSQDVEYESTSDIILNIDYGAETYLGNRQEGTKQRYWPAWALLSWTWESSSRSVSPLKPIHEDSDPSHPVTWRKAYQKHTDKSPLEQPQKESMQNNLLLSSRCKGELEWWSTCFCPQFHDHKPPPWAPPSHWELPASSKSKSAFVHVWETEREGLTDCGRTKNERGIKYESIGQLGSRRLQTPPHSILDQDCCQ